ncbi:MAG: putative sugar transporter, ATP-binding protein [Clostridiales bacterium]|nr:putative sugar transporter, ATP-binding protein [Clostridiales bacterium]
METLAVKMLGITKIFNNVKAIDRVDFELKKGSIHGLLGENGAGKTTLMNVLYGLYKEEEGEIFINGNKEEIFSPVKAISLGIGMVHQHFMLARPLSVVENVMLGRKSRRGILLDTNQTAEELKVLAEKYKMDIDPYSKIWQLSVGEQQRVEILTAIYQGAEILILDEPTAVLTPQEVDAFFCTLREMKDDGKSIILITHKLEEIISIDEVTVLRDGKLIDTKVVDDKVTKDDLTRMMVGKDVMFDFPENTKEPGKIKYCIKNICAKNDKGLSALKDFSLDIREGEIVGLAGVDGNGQRELCEVLTGLRKADSGEIELNKNEIINKPPVFYIEQGISHIPEDRHTTGLALNWSLKRNLILKELNKAPYVKNGLLQPKVIDKHWEEARKEYQIKSINGDEKARALSGGNQQKIILAREINLKPQVLIANQPTRGLDVSAAEYVRQQILNARNNGAAVLLISADLEEIIQLSDRIAVICGGKLMGILPRCSATCDIGALMMGKLQEVANCER